MNDKAVIITHVKLYVKKLNLIWIQTFCHSDAIPESFNLEIKLLVAKNVKFTQHVKK